MMEPVVEELSQDFDKKITIAQVDVDQSQDLANLFGIRSIPTMVIFKDGNTSLGQKELIDTAGREHLVLYQADIFQVPRLISLFGIKPTLTSLLVFKKGQLVDKKEV